MKFNSPKGQLMSLWMNYMRAGEYNPFHNHAGSLSFVIYIDVPNEIYKEENPANGHAPGTITFMNEIAFFDRLPFTSDKKEEKNLETTLLIDPANEEAILMLMEIGIKKTNYSKVKELSERFTKVCKNLCNENEKILQDLKNLEPKNES